MGVTPTRLFPGHGNALNLQRKFFLGTIGDRAPVANLWRPIFHRMHERRLTLTEVARAVTDNPRDFANCKRELQEMRWFVADIDHMLRLIRVRASRRGPESFLQFRSPLFRLC